MTAAEKYIKEFNQLNGKPVKKSDLQKLHRKVLIVDDPALAELAGRLSKAITKINGHTVTAEIKPIALPKRKPVVEKADASMLRGIECIQNDKHLHGASLGELNDTTYKVITDKILSLIKSGGLVWRKPWNENHQGKTSHAHNYVTKHYYRGTNFYLNYLLLEDYSSPRFFTFKQVSEKGAKVKAGQKGWPVIYFKWLYKKLKGNVLVDEKEATVNGKLKPGYDKFPALFYYIVFNEEQCEGLKLPKFKAIKLTAKEKIESCERIVEGMPKRPKITNQRGDDAYYRPSTDSIVMPLMEQFKVDQQYYSTLFHELTHSTGAKHRLDRDLTGKFGSKSYAFEELIAELSASYLCGETGILYYTVDNSAAYIKSWSGRLVEEMTADPKFFMRAAAAAEKASEFIIDRKKDKPATKVKAKRKLKVTSKSPVKRLMPKAVKVLKKKAVKVKPVTAISGFITADKRPEAPKNLVQLPGVMGDLLGKQQRYKLAIVVAGETHSSKSEIGKQIVDGFLSLGDSVAALDWEQGGLASRDTIESIERNISPENQSRLFVSGDYPRDLESLKELAKQFKVILLDSGSKLKEVTNAWIDTLRNDCPNTVWIILMQQNEKGGTRGGTAAEFDTPTLLKSQRGNGDYRTNYAVVEKNRGNPHTLGLHYMIADKKIVPNQKD